MNILAHRGMWKHISDKNSILALKLAIVNGFGVETDVRDYVGEIVISHDLPNEKSPKLEELLYFYYVNQSNSILALNIKSDGIQTLLKELLLKYGVYNYFLFDMSIPELVANHKKSLKFFTRYSDIENESVMIDEADGVWIDSFFKENWFTESIINNKFLGKKVCLVSPELHGLPHESTWKTLKNTGLNKKENFYLCTDYPEEARAYFNE